MGTYFAVIPEAHRLTTRRSPDASGTNERREDVTVKLSEIRALLKRAGVKTTAAIDRVDVKYMNGKAIGIDVMLTDGGLHYIPTEES
ncbi:hypothetical protein ACWGJ9_07340 [Curtobacterium citreum]